MKNLCQTSASHCGSPRGDRLGVSASRASGGRML